MLDQLTELYDKVTKPKQENKLYKYCCNKFDTGEGCKNAELYPGSPKCIGLDDPKKQTRSSIVDWKPKQEVKFWNDRGEEKTFPCAGDCCNGNKYCGNEKMNNAEPGNDNSFTEWGGWGCNCITHFSTGLYTGVKFENRKKSGTDWWYDGGAYHNTKGIGNKTAKDVKQSDRHYWSWYYPNPNDMDKDGKRACCQVHNNVAHQAWKNNMCKDGYENERGTKCPDIWYEYCRETNWNDRCLDWAAKPDNIARSRNELSAWCNADPARLSLDVCKCFDYAKWEQEKNNFIAECEGAGGGSSCQNYQNLTPTCDWAECTGGNKNAYAIAAYGGEKCRDINIQNCDIDVIVGETESDIIANCIQNVSEDAVDDFESEGIPTDQVSSGEGDVNVTEGGQVQPPPMASGGGGSSDDDNTMYIIIGVIVFLVIIGVAVMMMGGDKKKNNRPPPRPRGPPRPSYNPPPPGPYGHPSGVPPPGYY